MAKRKRSKPDVVPSSSGGRISSNQARIRELEALYERVRKQVAQHAEFPKIDEPSKRIDEAVVEVHNILMMPPREMLLAENYSKLVDALPYYAASHLSTEKAHALVEFQNKLPFLFADFQKALSDDRKVIKMSLLIERFTRSNEHYDHLKKHHIEINNRMLELKAQKKEFRDEEKKLKDEWKATLAAFEELKDEWKATLQKEQAKHVISEVEATLETYKQRLIG